MYKDQDFKAFIIIDDDPISIFICRQLIKRQFGQEIHAFDFTVPEHAIEHILSIYSPVKAPKTLMLLDVNTATLSAWDFLEKFEALEEPVKEAFRIYIISSSVDEGDRKKALGSRYVCGYFVKPLSAEAIKGIAQNSTTY